MRLLSASDPTVIGPYRIIGRLGAGGMGTVYAGVGRGGERLAVKVVNAGAADDPLFRSRFLREVRLLQSVSGPCLVPLRDADPSAAQPWLATDYIPGPTLYQYVTGRGPLPEQMVTCLAAGVAAALEHIHAAGIVHRDLKPGNVILAADAPWVLDFGIAHSLEATAITSTGLMTGTPGWVSPEQYTVGRVDTPADVFAWGALIAYAASGALPFGGGAPDVVAHRVMTADVDVSAVPEALQDLVAQSLSKDAAERPQASEIAAAAREILSSQATHVVDVAGSSAPTLVSELIGPEWQMPTIEDPQWNQAPPPVRFSGRRRTVLLIAAGLLAFGAAGTATALLGPGGASGAAVAAQSPAAGHSTSPTRSPRAAVSPSAPGPGSEPPSSLPVTTTPAAVAQPGPAYTRTDTQQPQFAEYAQARPAESVLERAFVSDVQARLGAQGFPASVVDIRFNDGTQTVWVVWTQTVGGAMGDLMANFQASAGAVTCNAVRYRLGAAPEQWAYGRWAITWVPANTGIEQDQLYLFGNGSCTPANY